MDKLKKVVIFFGAIAIFYFVSNFLSEVVINSTYKPIERLDDNENIEIVQAEATLINGRIKAFVKDSSAKYLKLQLFSERDNNIGTRYIEIPEASGNSDSETDSEAVNRPVNIYYKIDNVKKYKVEAVSEKGPDENLNISLLPSDISRGDIILGVLILLILY